MQGVPDLDHFVQKLQRVHSKWQFLRQFKGEDLINLVEDLLTKNDVSASQLGCTSDLLSAIIVPVVTQFADSGHLAEGWGIDLNRFAKSRKERLQQYVQGVFHRRKVKKLLAATL